MSWADRLRQTLPPTTAKSSSQQLQSNSASTKSSTPPRPTRKRRSSVSEASPHLLLGVFHFLSARDLGGRCSKVCHAWRAIVHEPNAWRYAWPAHVLDTECGFGRMCFDPLEAILNLGGIALPPASAADVIPDRYQDTIPGSNEQSVGVDGTKVKNTNNSNNSNNNNTETDTALWNSLQARGGPGLMTDDEMQYVLSVGATRRYDEQYKAIVRSGAYRLRYLLSVLAHSHELRRDLNFHENFEDAGIAKVHYRRKFSFGGSRNRSAKRQQQQQQQQQQTSAGTSSSSPAAAASTGDENANTENDNENDDNSEEETNEEEQTNNNTGNSNVNGGDAITTTTTTTATSNSSPANPQSSQKQSTTTTSNRIRFYTFVNTTSWRDLQIQIAEQKRERERKQSKSWSESDDNFYGDDNCDEDNNNKSTNDSDLITTDHLHALRLSTSLKSLTAKQALNIFSHMSANAPLPPTIPFTVLESTDCVLAEDETLVRDLMAFFFSGEGSSSSHHQQHNRGRRRFVELTLELASGLVRCAVKPKEREAALGCLGDFALRPLSHMWLPQSPEDADNSMKKATVGRSPSPPALAYPASPPSPPTAQRPNTTHKKTSSFLNQAFPSSAPLCYDGDSSNNNDDNNIGSGGNISQEQQQQNPRANSDPCQEEPPSVLNEISLKDCLSLLAAPKFFSSPELCSSHNIGVVAVDPLRVCVVKLRG